MKLYNTLSRSLEEFHPVVEGEVRMYNCGPTVYNYIHVGNARPLCVFDTLRRYFIYKGNEVKFVVNFTDIDDKLINKANEENTTVREVAERFIKEFKTDANGLHLYDYNTMNPRATEHIQEIIDFIAGLVEKGAAYESDGDVYFKVESFKEYGKLSHKKLEDLISGARVDISSLKDNPADFALWKRKKEGEPYWESPWSEGRPGWHIECSVMAKSLLGETIDIHSGGEDLQFPHHENEIAQSETLNEKPFANYWLHNGMITVDNEKMSKSKGNFFTVREVAEEFDLEVLRFFLLSSHYRSPINFSRDVMIQTKNSLERIYNGRDKLVGLLDSTQEREFSDADREFLTSIEDEVKFFETSMENDINTADAITAIFNIVKKVNTGLDEESNKKVVSQTLETLNKLTKVLGILEMSQETDEEVEKLIEERVQARKNKDFNRADEIRQELLDMGVVIEDTRAGTKWKRA
ncbi:cysteinyl-tRNA synthetase [Peptoniphilus asaccharolyticus DSM 20463]|uniref:Cysteine--tRNA ligase n=1 Tax=Peptoniphilus asaccharolyticus DSM 20463 TaxID=573058 RepID=A0A1W1UJC9_PEPAS|nr:cysteine--tRNA ligase [Peptoniphilus asaccharolyticus]MBL7574775.1 cysteine--tRNA ligase [Peptoniphilus asaccharolyticus]SMB80901.1 cysteinyl-tRNA synthetase [Peptoniphilus asaccharolyticus DSM 20463]